MRQYNILVLPTQVKNTLHTDFFAAVDGGTYDCCWARNPANGLLQRFSGGWAMGSGVIAKEKNVDLMCLLLMWLKA